MLGEGVVEGVVVEGEVLVEGRDFVDSSEGYHENTMALLAGSSWEGGRVTRKGRACSMMR
jgi:hypothetical protein